MMFRPMPILSVFTIASLVILLMLGNWQYARYSEKTGQDDASINAPQGERLTIALERPEEGFAQQVYGKADSKPLWRRYAVGQMIGSDERLLVLVGVTEGPQPIQLRLNRLPETVTFNGNIIERTANRGLLSPKDQPDENIWNTMDPRLIAENLGLEQERVRIAEPVTLTVINASNPMQSRQTDNPYAFATPLDPLPPERHFGYALTWWGMALGLIGVYLALHHSRGRLRFRRGEK